MPKTLNKTRARRLLWGGVTEILASMAALLYPRDEPINNDHPVFRNDRKVVRFD
jgi:hypothetical protein